MEGQPIGEQLFKQFCSKDPQMARCIEYLSAVKEFNMVADEKCNTAARSVFDEYISTRVRRGGGRRGEECKGRVMGGGCTATLVQFLDD